MSSKNLIYYFEKVTKPDFDLSQPSQLLFSHFRKGKLIGYGELVHINWNFQPPEVSFLVETFRRSTYSNDFKSFLDLLCHLAFEDLQLHRIFRETYNFREEHLKILEGFGFTLEGVLREQVYKQKQWMNSIIHRLLFKEWKHAN